MQATWQSLAGQIDPQRHKEVADRLAIQVADARNWSDQIVRYFQTFSKLPVPAPGSGPRG
jgi:alpha-glucuronidase